MAGRRSDEEARATRAAILGRAVDVASVEGFEGLTIGSLARDLEMSKAGILGHFRTKEQLQLDAYAQAREQFKALVWDPAASEPAGLPRLRAICDRWAAFVGAPPWPGGCVLIAGSFEFDDRTGPLADAMREHQLAGRARLEQELRTAVDARELPPETDPAQVAFELVALATGTVQATRMHRDPAAGDRLRAAYAARLAG